MKRNTPTLKQLKTLADVKKEMQQPRQTESVREALRKVHDCSDD
jgi:hypothetical protein